MPRTLKLIFASLSIYSFSTSLISIFVPIFLIQHGFSLAKIVFVFLVYALSKLVLNYPAVRFVVRRGTRSSLALNYVIGVAALILLNVGLIKLSYPLVLVSFAASALSDALQWNAQHLHLSSLLDGIRKSSSLALFSNTATALGILGPLLGGLIAGYLGSTMLLVVASVVGVAAITPLYWGGFEHHEITTSTVPYNLKGAPIKDLIANAAWNTETAIAIYIWPMYVLLFIGKLQNIGVLVAFGSLLTFIVVYVAGKRSDKSSAKGVINEGSVLSSIFHIMRAFAHTMGTVVVGDLGYKVSQKYMEIGWVSTYYGHAKGSGLAYINSMEISGDLARLAMWSIVWVVALTAPSNEFYRISFLLASVVTLFCMVISKERPLRVSS